MSDRQQQAERLRAFANRATCRGGGEHYCPNCDNGIEFPVDAIQAGASALAREQEMVEALREMLQSFDRESCDVMRTVDPVNAIARAKYVLAKAEIPMTDTPIRAKAREDYGFASEVIEAFLAMGVCPSGYDRDDLRDFAKRLREADPPAGETPKHSDALCDCCPDPASPALSEPPAGETLHSSHASSDGRSCLRCGAVAEEVAGKLRCAVASPTLSEPERFTTGQWTAAPVSPAAQPEEQYGQDRRIGTQGKVVTKHGGHADRVGVSERGRSDQPRRGEAITVDAGEVTPLPVRQRIEQAGCSAKARTATAGAREALIILRENMESTPPAPGECQAKAVLLININRLLSSLTDQET